MHYQLYNIPIQMELNLKWVTPSVDILSSTQLPTYLQDQTTEREWKKMCRRRELILGGEVLEQAASQKISWIKEMNFLKYIDQNRKFRSYTERLKHRKKSLMDSGMRGVQNLSDSFHKCMFTLSQTATGGILSLLMHGRTSCSSLSENIHL